MTQHPALRPRPDRLPVRVGPSSRLAPVRAAGARRARTAPPAELVAEALLASSLIGLPPDPRAAGVGLLAGAYSRASAEQRGADGDRRPRQEHQGRSDGPGAHPGEAGEARPASASKITRVEVDFSEIRNPRVHDNELCEVTVHLKGHFVKAHAASTDQVAALDLVIDKVEHQVTRLKESKVDRTHQPRRRRLAAAAAARGLGRAPPARRRPGSGGNGDGHAEIIRTKQFTAKPMTVEEAALQMDLLGHDFYLFNERPDRTRDGALPAPRRSPRAHRGRRLARPTPPGAGRVRGPGIARGPPVDSAQWASSRRSSTSARAASSSCSSRSSPRSPALEPEMERAPTPSSRALTDEYRAALRRRRRPRRAAARGVRDRARGGAARARPAPLRRPDHGRRRRCTSAGSPR